MPDAASDQGTERRGDTGDPGARRSEARGLGKQLPEETPVEVELAEETKHGQFTAAATVSLKGQSLRAAESTSDLRGSIDKLVENLERQVVGYREKRRFERRRRTEHHRV